MNHLNELETELESWIPRHPSAKIKERLYPRAAEAAAHVAPHWPAWAWLAPVAAACALVLLIGGTRHEKLTCLAVVPGGGSNILAGLYHSVAVSNRTILPELSPAAGDSSRLNVWAAASSPATFEWTSAVPSLTTTGSFPSWKTNIQKL